MGDAPVTPGPAQAGPLAIFEALLAVFFVPGRVAAGIVLDDARSQRQAARIGLGSLVVMVVATAFVVPPSQRLWFEAIMLMMCVNGLFYYPFMRPLSWRTLTLRHFAHVYAYVLPFGVVQMVLYGQLDHARDFLLYGLLVGLWEGLALAILLRRTLAFAYWRSFVGVAIGTAAQWAFVFVFTLTTSGFHF